MKKVANNQKLVKTSHTFLIKSNNLVKKRHKLVKKSQKVTSKVKETQNCEKKEKLGKKDTD